MVVLGFSFNSNFFKNGRGCAPSAWENEERKEKEKKEIEREREEEREYKNRILQ